MTSSTNRSVFQPHMVHVVVEGEAPIELVHLDELGSGPDPQSKKPFAQLSYSGIWWWRASAALPERHENRSLYEFYCVALSSPLTIFLESVLEVHGLPVVKRHAYRLKQLLTTFTRDYADPDGRPARRLPLDFAFDMHLSIEGHRRFSGQVLPPYNETGPDPVELILPDREPVGRVGQELCFALESSPLSWLSPLSPHPISVDGTTWPSVEHFFRGMGAADDEGRRRILEARLPKEAHLLGLSFPTRTDWEEIRVEIMRRGLAAKMQQHRDLRAHLVATGDCRIVFISPDPFWGSGEEGPTSEGLNWLGRLFMELRTKLIDDER